MNMTMNHQEFNAAVKKQQSLIRKLFSNRERRSEVINELTQQRYGHLRGKFFRPREDGELFKGEDGKKTYYIHAFEARSNYDHSDTVNIDVLCRSIETRTTGTGRDAFVSGVIAESYGFRFSPEDDIEKILAPLWVTREEAVRETNGICEEFVRSFLRKG